MQAFGRYQKKEFRFQVKKSRIEGGSTYPNDEINSFKLFQYFFPDILDLRMIKEIQYLLIR